MTVRCSSYTDESLPGTATVELGWLCIENDGGWGRDPFAGDTFAPDVGAAIERFADRHDLRVLLIRRPGGSGGFRSRRRIFVANSVPGATSLRQFEVEDYAEILDLDVSNADAGEPAPPIALVCTNGKRDVCCAVAGRPLAAALAACYADPVVWECSHTGGHRFAPVLIVLPSGYTYGRLPAAQAKEVFDAARDDLVLTTGLRGRSSTPPLAQVADVAVRERLGPCGADVLRVTADASADPDSSRSGDAPVPTATVRHLDGRQWRVGVAADDLEPRVASCGKSPSPARSFRVATFARDADVR